MNSFSDVWLQEIKIIVNTVESSKLFQIGDENQSIKNSRNSRSSKHGNLTQETELRDLFQPRSQKRCFSQFFDGCGLSKSQPLPLVDS